METLSDQKLSHVKESQLMLGFSGLPRRHQFWSLGRGEPNLHG
jgi:hypothetical protein